MKSESRGVREWHWWVLKLPRGLEHAAMIENLWSRCSNGVRMAYPTPLPPQEVISGLTGGGPQKLHTFPIGEFGIPKGTVFCPSRVLAGLEQPAPRTNEILGGWKPGTSHCWNLSGECNVQPRPRSTAVKVSALLGRGSKGKAAPINPSERQ